jgi:hypothetical protein
MMNARELQHKLSSPDGRVKKLAESKLGDSEIVTELYLSALNRFPSDSEIEIASGAFKTPKTSRQEAAEDLLWALLNSPEFVFNH